MRIALVALILILVLSFVISAQSGRRVTPAPSPSPAAKQDDPTQFSESKPHAPRTTRLSDRFPGIGVGSNAKTVPS